MEKKQLEDAIDLLRESLLQEKYEDTERLARVILEKVPDETTVLYLLGLSLTKQGKREEGTACLERSIEQEPEDYHKLKRCGIWFHSLGAIAESTQYLLRYFLAKEERDPKTEDDQEDVELRTVATMRLHDRGELDLALRLLNDGMDRNPHTALYFCEAGRIFGTMGDPIKALSLYEDALDINPHYGPALMRMNKILIDLQRYDEAKLAQERLYKMGTSDNIVSGTVSLSGLVDPIQVLTSSMGLTNKQKWHKTNTVHFFPAEAILQKDFKKIIRSCVVEGTRLPGKIFTPSSKLVTFGSCFASHMRDYLKYKNRSVDQISIPEGLNNTFALESFIAWCLAGKTNRTDYWYDNNAMSGAYKWEPTAEQSYYQKILQQVDGFIFTLGLSEVWKDKSTGGVFWRGVPENLYDPEKHELVVSTVDENVKNLESLCRTIRETCGDKPIIFTLSPVPLTATFRDTSCIVADSVSKSILRVSLDVLMQKEGKNIYYWPSFEMVRWLGSHLEFPLYGRGHDMSTADDALHVQRPIVDQIISLFEELYFE